MTDVPERERFEARDDDGALAGVLTYQLTGGIIAYTHTQVEPAFEGRGSGRRWPAPRWRMPGPSGVR